MDFNGQVSEDESVSTSRLPVKIKLRQKYRRQVHAVYNKSLKSSRQTNIKDVIETSRDLEDIYRTIFKRYKLPAFTKKLRSLTLTRPINEEASPKIEDLETKPGKINVVSPKLFAPLAPAVVTRRPISIRKKSSTNLFWEGTWGEHLTYRSEYDQLQTYIEESSDSIPKFMKLNERTNNRAALIPTSQIYSTYDKQITPKIAGKMPFPHVKYLPSRIRRARLSDQPLNIGRTSNLSRKLEEPWRYSPDSSGVFKMNFTMS